ncbi:MAG: hypothetical protein Q7R62_01565, partial [bacterium]|nr:hypothetical protein [bacterium]
AGDMVRFKFPRRDNLGWLIPVLLLLIFYGSFLWFNEEGFLGQLGILFFIIGILGLSFSRRVRRLVAYHLKPRTAQSKEAFIQGTIMESAKRLAQKEDVPKLVTDLYFDYVIHLPQWLSSAKEKLDDEVVIPELITDAKKMPGNRIIITLAGKEYIFTFVQYISSTQEGEHDVQATLQVSVANQKLILLHLVPISEDANAPLHPISIEYVVMSDWINDFRHLRELIIEEQGKRRREDRMN